MIAKHIKSETQEVLRDKIMTMLSEANVRPSTTRFYVLKYLIQQENHPTIDTVYRDLFSTLPGLSKMSIYNSMRALEKAGLVRSLAIEGNEMRYDARVEFHAHFKCEQCGEIFDVMVEETTLPEVDLEGFSTKKQDLFLIGLCPKCNVRDKQTGNI